MVVQDWEVGPVGRDNWKTMVGDGYRQPIQNRKLGSLSHLDIHEHGLKEASVCIHPPTSSQC